ncbi:hypothetical protein JXR93_00565 [bacterium]|nr:hypothetical protein [bacterium]
MVKYFFMMFLFSFLLFSAPELEFQSEEIPMYRGKVVSIDNQKNIITLTLLNGGKTVKISPEEGVSVMFYGKKGKKMISTTNIILKNEIAIISIELHKDLLKKSVDIDKIYKVNYIQMD